MPSPRAGKRNNPPKSARARLLREQPPFTIDSLRALLRDKVLGRRLKMPDGAALGELATYLNFHQRHYIDINESAARNALRDRAQAALDETAAAFSDLRETIDSFYGKQPNPIVNAAMKKRLVQIDALLAAITTINKNAFWNEFWERDTSRPDRNAKWRELLYALTTDFQNAMKTTNRDARFGLSETGPLVRYLVAVIPAITGEQIAAGTVKRHGHEMQLRSKTRAIAKRRIALGSGA